MRCVGSLSRASGMRVADMDHPQAGDLLVWGTRCIYVFVGWSADDYHYYVWSPVSPGRLTRLAVYVYREFDGGFWTRCIRMPERGIDG